MRSDEERLRDIADAAQRVADRVARGRKHFDEDEDTRLAVVHLIEVIGEACTQVSDGTKGAHPDLPWREAAAMRNRVIHGYFDVDDDVVWSAAELEIPALAAGVRRIVQAAGRDQLSARETEEGR